MPGDSVAAAALDLIDRGIVVTDSLARIRVANDFGRDMANNFRQITATVNP